MNQKKENRCLVKVVHRLLYFVLVAFMIGVIEQPAYAANAGLSFATAVSLSAGTVKQGTTASGDYYYKFLKDTGYCTVIVSMATGGSKTATLYDSNYNRITSCTSSSTARAATTSTQYLLGGSNYYIKVSGGSGEYSISYTYHNSLDTITEKTTSRYDSFSDAKEITAGKIYKGQLGYKDTSDSYYLNIPHSGTLKITKFFVSGTDASSSLRGTLYNSTQSTIGSFVTVSGSSDIYSGTVKSGRNYIIISGGSGGYYLTTSYNDPGHKYDDWKITKAPTCTEVGLKKRTCEECGYTQSSVIAAGHKYKHHKVAAKIGIEGKEYDECTGCGDVINQKTLPALKPATTKITQLSAIKKGFTVKWAKKAYTGYQIRYSLKSSMASAKKVFVTKASTVSKKITKLKAKKKYYVQIRTYKTVNGEKVYSAWSPKKSVKTK